MIQKFPFAIRVWRIVIYTDDNESLRHGGIVTNIGDAHFITWRIAAVGSLADRISIWFHIRRMMKGW